MFEQDYRIAHNILGLYLIYPRGTRTSSTVVRNEPHEEEYLYGPHRSKWLKSNTFLAIELLIEKVLRVYLARKQIEQSGGHTSR